MSDKKPVVPLDFPKYLRGPILLGWSKEPKGRPSIEAFKSALLKMLTADRDHSLTSPETNSSKEKELVFLDEVNSADNDFEDYEAGSEIY